MGITAGSYAKQVIGGCPRSIMRRQKNTGNAKRLAGAMLRAYVGMSGTHVMKKDYAAAMAWGELGLDRAKDIVGISHNPIYGIFVETTAYMYEGDGVEPNILCCC